MNVGQLKAFLAEIGNDDIEVVVPARDHTYRPAHMTAALAVKEPGLQNLFEFSGDEDDYDVQAVIKPVVIIS